MSDNCNTKLNLASQACAEVKGKGIVKLSVENKYGTARMIEFKNTLYVPDLRTNLVSVSKITDKGHSVTFFESGAHVCDENGNIIIIADRRNDLFIVRETINCAVAQTKNTELIKWHYRMGHLNLKDINKLIKGQILPQLDMSNTTDIEKCIICAKGKMVATSFGNKHESSTEILNVVHSDLVGPFRVESLQGEKYFVTFIDECTRWCQIYFLHTKSDVLKAFKLYHKFVENYTEKRIKFLQSDNGREYLNNAFDMYLNECGIGRRNTIPRTPQQNGIAERFNRTVMDMARCLLFQAGLSDTLWSVAVSAACYIRNRCPSSSLNGLTPYEMWFKRKPKLNHMRIFGAKVFVLNKEPNNSKLAPKAREGVFVGYPYNRKGYRIWLPDRRQVIDARDVKFVDESVDVSVSSHHQNDLLAEGEIKSNTNNDIEFLTTIENTEKIQEVEIEQKRGRGRPAIIRTGYRGRPRKRFNTVGDKNEIGSVGAESENNSGEEEIFTDAEDEIFAGVAEINIKDALQGTEADEWYRAIENEIASILKHDTWDVVKVNVNGNIVGCRFVLTNKCSSDGKIERRKARLVAKGYNQQYGVNYFHTFAPVARLETLRLMLALSVRFEFIVWQFDVVTAYLNGTLDEIVIMKVPVLLGVILERIVSRAEDSAIKEKALKMLKDLQSGGNACKLKRSLYGLKQAGRQWYTRLRTKLESMGLRCTINEPCFFFGTFNGSMLMLLVYVDDLLVASRNMATIQEMKRRLQEDFEIKDIGQASYCLGLEIIQNNALIILKQKGYIKHLLKTYGMAECNSVATPGEPKMHSTIIESQPYTGPLYRELIGALMYLSVASRPDIANVVARLAQFVNSPSYCHWQCAKRVLRYLAGSAEKGLVYKMDNKNMQCYVDSDWGGCVVDRRSYTGFAFILSGAAVTWKSQKQRTVALSSTEAEYVSLTEAGKDAIYLKSLLSELGFKSLANIVIFVDNRGALFLANNSIIHGRSKHIDIKCHFIRESLAAGLFQLKHIPTQQMIADIMTKPLPRVNHEKCVRGLGFQ